MNAPTYTPINIAGVNVTPFTKSSFMRYVQACLAKKKKMFVCVAAAHLIVECQKNELLKRDISQGIVVSDGMPLVWLLHAYGKRFAQRIYGPDTMLSLCEYAERNNIKIFLLGGAQNQAKQVQDALLVRFPKLRVSGIIDTPSRSISPSRNEKIIRDINASGADIVFVGMGCPHQELWMIQNRTTLRPPILIGVGAAFDFISGRTTQAPVWMRNSGLEWLFRLSQEPKRLFRRYTFVNISFIGLVAKQLFYDFALRARK